MAACQGVGGLYALQRRLGLRLGGAGWSQTPLVSAGQRRLLGWICARTCSARKHLQSPCGSRWPRQLNRCYPTSRSIGSTGLPAGWGKSCRQIRHQCSSPALGWLELIGYGHEGGEGAKADWQIAQPLPRDWMEGSMTDLSRSATPAFTESAPPKLESVVILGFSYSSRVMPSSCSRVRCCFTTPRGWRRQGTNGKWRTGGATQPSSTWACTDFSAMAISCKRDWWWKTSTMSKEQSDRTSTPPSPIWSTISRSCQLRMAATRRTASLSIWRLGSPLGLAGNVVWRVERRTGWHWVGSRQSQMIPRAQGCSCAGL